MIRKRCDGCQRIFECTGSCGVPERIEDRQTCACPDCVMEATLWARSKCIDNFKGLSEEEVFARCYGYERGMESE